MEYQLLDRDIMQTIEVPQYYINYNIEANINNFDFYNGIHFSDYTSKSKIDYIIDWIFTEHFPYFRLCEFFKNNDAATIKHTLGLYPNMDQRCECCGNTFLHLAVHINSLEIADLVIKTHINAMNNNNETVLHVACIRSNLQMIKYLLSRGADPNLSDSADVLPLHICLAKYELRAAEMLISNGAQVDVLFSQSFKLSPLHVAMQKGSKNMVEMLLKYGAAVNVKDYNGESPLYLAVKLGVEEAIPQLLKAGADLNMRYKKNRTILHIACKYNREDCVQMLLHAGVKVKSVDDDGMSALHFAVRTDQFGSVDMLVACGCKIDPEDNWRRTPLYMAILNNQLRMIVCLLSYGANTKSIMTPLQVAVKRGFRDVIRIFLHHGINVNAQDQFGKKLLHTAVYHGDEYMVEYLLKQGADPNIRGDLNCPIITNAIRRKHVNIVRLLVKYGANICLCDDVGRTPIFHAVKIENLEIAKILMDTGIQTVIEEAKSYCKTLYNSFLYDFHVPNLYFRS